MLSKRGQQVRSKSSRSERGSLSPSESKTDQKHLPDSEGDPAALKQPSFHPPWDVMSASKSSSSAINPFRKMICQLAELLTFDDIKEMIFFLTKCKLVDDSQYQGTSLYCFKETWENEETVTEDTVDFLIKVLRKIKSEDALRVVENYKKYLPKEDQSRLDFVSELTNSEVSVQSTQNAIKTSKSSTSYINPFRKMIRQLAKLLSFDDIDEMVFLTKCKIVDEIKYRRTPFYSLIETLENEEKVTENRVDFLIELLKEIESEDALRLVENYKTCLPKEEQSVSRSVSEPPKAEDSKHLSNTERLATYKQLQETEINSTPGNLLGTCDKLSETQVEGADFCSQSSSSILENISQILCRFGISNESGRQIGVMYCMTIDEIHLKESNVSPQNIVTAFLTRLISYDYRTMRLFKELEPIAGFKKSKNKSSKNIKSFKSLKATNNLKLSCRDMTFVILNCCDPFLIQKVLSKMSHCQLAVPVLLPTFDHLKVVLLLWGLLETKKVWRDPDSNEVHEKFVVKFPFSVVSVLRVGNVDHSKSKILNKMLGPIQNNSEHPYFISSEQDSSRSTLSQGTVEGIWYLPGTRRKDKYSLINAFCCLNLRGDAEEFQRQRQYVSQISILTIVFINRFNMRSKAHIIEEVATTSKVILVVCGKNDMSTDGIAMAKGEHITVLDASGLNTVDIGEYLCTEVNKVLSHSTNGSGRSLENSLPICSESEIFVDLLEPVCSQAKQAVQDILSSYKEGPKKFKSNALPLHLKCQNWSEMQNAKDEQRKQQHEVAMSTEIQRLYQELSHPDKKYKQYLVFWLQHFLNEKSVASLKPLIDNLKYVRGKIRETVAKITFIRRRLEDDTAIPNKERKQMAKTINELSTEESKLHEKLMQTTHEFDAWSLGFEHFIRELGQLYQRFLDFRRLPDKVRDTLFDAKSLPRMAAEMLLNGHPLEIFDGDTYHVPIKWVEGVLSAVIDITGDRRIYVISVLGIQSSGKSTLLNSLFGVNFAVRAGRCTRGILLQLLPIDDEVKQKLDCDYIAVIDTEGLKAPEKALVNQKNEDYELATFALCLSDMNLINIGGQTVGEDLLNVLQICARAFIRMKEVNFLPLCYLIQQFVADVTASQRNQNSTQSILQTLDQAVATAAVDEGKQDKYRQFSDCFNIINLDGNEDDVQYIPSLWRTGMSAPNYEYSEAVLQLKSALLQNVSQKDRKQTMSEFTNRIAIAWNVVKKEDFVYDLHTTTEFDQYNNFTLLYKRAQWKFIREIIKWELDARQKIRNTAAENVINRRDLLYQELNEKVTSEIDKLQKTVEDELRKREYESVRRHATYFTMDVELVGKRARVSARRILRLETSIIKTKDLAMLPKVKAHLRQQLFTVAEKLKQTLSHVNPASRIPKSEEEFTIQDVFEVEWAKQLKDVQWQYPTDPEEDIKQHIELSMRYCIEQSLENTDLSNEMKKLLSEQSLGELCVSSPEISGVNGIRDAINSIRTCSKAVAEHLQNQHKLVTEALSKPDFLFSAKFVKSIRENVRQLVNERCKGCKGKTELLVCLVCNVLSEAHEVSFDNVLSMIVRNDLLLKRLDIKNVLTPDAIASKVASTLQIMRPRMSQGELTKVGNFFQQNLAFWPSGDEVDEKFLKTIKIQFEHLLLEHDPTLWYSETTTRAFLKLVLQLLGFDKRDETTERDEQLLLLSCRYFVEEAVKCEKQYLSERKLPEFKLKRELGLQTLTLLEHKDLLLETMKGTLPEEVVSILRGMQQQDIQKHAHIPFLQRRHVLDRRFLSLLPQLSTAKYDTILSIIADSQELFLKLLFENRVYNENIMTCVITTTMEELNKSNDLDKPEKILSIAFICSWGLPICQAMQITFAREHSMQFLLEQERGRLYSEFRDLCQGACQDLLAAKSFSSIIELSLTESIKSRVCSSLFERLTKSGENIFSNRARFLKVILKSLCRNENFRDYTSFVCQHNSFITEWTLLYIARQCRNRAGNGISIRDVAVHEIKQLLQLTEIAFQTALQSVQNSNDNNFSFQQWLQIFIRTFENNVHSSLYEEALTEFGTNIIVSDFHLFTEECVNIIRKFAQSSLLESLCLPDTSDVANTKNWFRTLPKKIHVLLAEGVEGCGARCPFCKSFCDETVREHELHFSKLHFPRGVSGVLSKGNGRLLSDTCTAIVASDKSFHTCRCKYAVKCHHQTIPFKDYKSHFPNWHIKQVTDYEPTLYWKWVLIRFNEEFAKYYGGKPALIPWGVVTKEQALNSIEYIDS